MIATAGGSTRDVEVMQRVPAHFGRRKKGTLGRLYKPTKFLVLLFFLSVLSFQLSLSLRSLLELLSSSPLPFLSSSSLLLFFSSSLLLSSSLPLFFSEL